MIIVLKKGVSEQEIAYFIHWIEEQHVKAHPIVGEFQTVVGLIGDVSKLDLAMIQQVSIVDSVKRISEPYKRVNRVFHPDESVIKIGEEKIGGGFFSVIAGPCSVESREQIIEVARCVKAAGATMLRGGAFKPRTSPYDFQGMKASGIELLLEAKRETGLPVVSEIMDTDHLPLFEDVDVIQVGARNMQNFTLLKALGRIDKPILLKRGLANTLQELLMAAEYIASEGNENIILCERGIRTFETYTRNTLDLSAVPALHQLTHLPVVVDPSHATGKRDLVAPMAAAAVACGADGVMIEVHNNPAKALCDGAQSITPNDFEMIMKKIWKVREAMA